MACIRKRERGRTIFVTGANKGIGFEVIKKLLNDPTRSKNDIILLGSRDEQRGNDALKQLGCPSNVHLVKIDTSSASSIAQAIDEIKQKYGGQLDVLINNAGILHMESTFETTRKLFDTNYYGIKLLNESILDLIKENGRIINVASETGAWLLHGMSKDLQEKYKSPTLSADELNVLAEEFISSFETNNTEKLGYPIRAPFLSYSVSKTALIALTRVQARDWSDARHILVFSVCPGYCATDMTKHDSEARSVELGADSILYLVNTPSDKLENGQFYQDGQLKSQHYPCDMDVTRIQEYLNK